MSKLLNISIAVLLLATPAWADWDRGDDYKMHWPQLPDPTGWDVYADATRDPANPGLVADDWLCTESGPVDDIHLWGSWSQDMHVDPNSGEIVLAIDKIHVSIHADIPDPDGEGPGYSRPGELLWERDFDSTQFTERHEYQGVQGFYIPDEGVFPEDHSLFHQINIDEIRDPFIQVSGTIYWLDIQVTHAPETADAWWGWKTSQDHFNDDAVWWDSAFQDPSTPSFLGGWRELRDPLNEEISLDMAFVITPEPATMLVLGLGLIPALLRRRRKV